MGYDFSIKHSNIYLSPVVNSLTLIETMLSFLLAKNPESRRKQIRRYVSSQADRVKITYQYHWNYTMGFQIHYVLVLQRALVTSIMHVRQQYTYPPSLSHIHISVVRILLSFLISHHIYPYNQRGTMLDLRLFQSLFHVGWRALLVRYVYESELLNKHSILVPSKRDNYI